MNLFEALRQFRILDLAIFDFVLAFGGVYLLAPILSKLFLKLGLDIPKLSWMLFVPFIGIIAHLLVGRGTPLTHDFLDISGHYLEKILILGPFFIGLKFIKSVKNPSKK